MAFNLVNRIVMKRQFFDILLSFFLLWLLPWNSSLGKEQKKMKNFIRVVKIDENCDHNIPFNFIKVLYINTTSTSPDSQVFNAAFELVNPPRQLQYPGLVTIFKCPSKSMESCLEVIKFKFEFCAILNAKHIVQTYLQKIHPRFKCPLKTQKYELRNFSVETDEYLALVPKPLKPTLHDSFFALRTQFIGDNKNKVTCVDIMAKLDRVKIRNQ